MLIQSNKRQRAVRLADAVNAIEGAPVRSYAKQLSAQWVNGRITAQQMKAAILLSHKQLAAKVGNFHE